MEGNYVALYRRYDQLLLMTPLTIISMDLDLLWVRTEVYKQWLHNSFNNSLE